MIANAILDALTVVAISAALSRTLPGGWAQIAVILSVLINAIPLGWENMVLGFNTHFYLLLAFSFGVSGFWRTAGRGRYDGSPEAFARLLHFSVWRRAPLTLGAAIGLHLRRSRAIAGAGSEIGLELLRSARSRSFWRAWICTRPGLAGWARIPAEFAAAFFHFASWPPPFPLGLIIAAPSLIFCIITLVDRPALTIRAGSMSGRTDGR